ncbi:MAG: transglycosylase domain-containing protein [Bdellovibrionales bacterium]|nr:transglycosylase domain-containing protein [Bdellovibrionales bacterium]
MKKTIALFSFLFVISLVFIYALYFLFLIRELPSVESLKNYKPPLISTVLDREGRKAGEFFKERRVLVPYSEFPPVLVQAFVSAEDGRFFEHKGLNLKAIFRAFLANLKAGRKVQGGSTITQQVARSLLLSSEKTYKRKFKEAVLALRMEKHLSKEEILYLYLNQIYLGHGAYGVGMAAEIYFRKKVKDLNLEEGSLLAGLPQAPSRFSPIYNPKKAKERQVYVLQRMEEESYIDKETMHRVNKTPLKVFLRGKYHEKAPYYMETLRQSLLKKIGEELLLTGGVTIKSSLDLSLQELARKHLQGGLRDLDKRQGFRGPLAQLDGELAIGKFFEEEEKKLMGKRRQFRVIRPIEEEGEREEDREEAYLKEISTGDIFKALISEVSDESKKVLIRLPFKAIGVLPLENMKWARKPNPKVSFKFSLIEKPSLALKKGDVVFVKVEKPLLSEEEQAEFLETGFKGAFFGEQIKPLLKEQEGDLKKKKFFLLSLEQEPLVEGALIAFDQKTEDILALVGGYDFHRSQFNRTYQAARQTGSVFKPLVYLAALDKGFTPASLITDAPVVYAEEEAEGAVSVEKRTRRKAQKTREEEEAAGEEEEQKMWKPDNYGRRFSGDILFRNALIRSMNVPTVKLIENIGIEWVSDYARRLGIFSPLNPDYTLALGSSSVTLYEMTKAFSVLGRWGKRIRPLILHEVQGAYQEKILGALSLDDRFFEQMQPWDQTMKEKREEFFKGRKELKDPLKEETELNEQPKLKKAAASLNKKFPLFFFSDPDQLISEKTAFIMTTLLRGVIREPQGTGGAAREIKWPIAGKTGTTNGYYDAWFIGYSSQIAVGVWLGFDDEKTLGRGETGAKAALPIWLNFMKSAHEEKEKEDFLVPEGIVFTNIDNETGQLVSTQSKQIIRQAFIEGTQPQEGEEFNEEEDQDFLREDFSQ